MEKYYTAVIIVTKIPGRVDAVKEGKKYRNVHLVDNFMQFVKKTFPSAIYVNFYSKTTRLFEFREYVD